MEKGNEGTTSGPQVLTASSPASGGSTKGSATGADVNQGAVTSQQGGGGRVANSTKERGLASASSTDEHGVTTTAFDTPDHGRWVGEEGGMSSPADHGMGDYASSGSTNPDGTRTEMSRDADGKVIRTTFDADGRWVQSEHFDADGNAEWINTPEGGYQRPG